ncbi:sodium-dependent transporter [Parahaliea maris]|uniref:Sodium-dependent transporter n=1 Tax=Parahaliea maris TaxID=2716870 RepID=A0A5C8ZUD8_9GAMM|nr:sodium-dependent transporter [Parahaliea maris]TXS91260.1 sodium-dependent transporter [Parahaliea maris]
MTFVLALAVFAVGLGNLWRFSYLTGEHGGGAFVLLYVICLFALAVPALIAEVVLGNYTRAGPLLAVRDAADRSLRSRGWTLLAIMASASALLVLAYYVVVAGWALSFAGSIHAGAFSSASLVNVGEFFDALLQDLPRQLQGQGLFLLLVLGVVGVGVRRGTGLAVWLLLPGFIALLGVLVQFAFEEGDLAATREFLFSAQLLDFDRRSLLAAMGQAFYTLGIGLAVGVVYGASAPERVPVGRSVIAVALFDTLISIAAGIAIFPVLFAHNVAPASGPGLLFIAAPYAFGNTVNGELFGALFFLLVVVAALGAAIALLEVVVSALCACLPLRRRAAVPVAGGLCAILVVLLTESLAMNPSGQGGLFVWLDRLTGEWLLPVNALLLCLFVGWRMRRELLRACLYREQDGFFSLWYGLIRYIAPPAIALVLLSTLWSQWWPVAG